MGRLRHLAALLLVVALCAGAVPAVGIAVYTYGGQYYHEAYPLQQSSEWLDTAQASAGQAPAYANSPQALAVLIEGQTSRAWTYLNVSQKNAGVGLGSPCWYFATPKQTYGYSQAILFQTFAYLANLTRDNTSFFTNSQWMAVFGEVSTQLGSVNNSIVINDGNTQTIEGCVFQGEWTWFAWFFSDLAVFIILVVLVIGLEPYRRRKRDGKFVAEQIKSGKLVYNEYSSKREPHKLARVSTDDGQYVIYDDGKWVRK